MNERLEQMRNQGLTVWQALDTRKRIAVVAISVAVLIGLLSLAVFTGKDDYVPLYTGLTTADAYEVMERLKSDGIPYRLADEEKPSLSRPFKSTSFVFSLPARAYLKVEAPDLSCLIRRASGLQSLRRE